MDADKIIAELRRQLSGVYEVRGFLGTRSVKGVDYQVAVKVYYADGQWMAEATREDGVGTSGNASESMEAAIAMVHWSELDAPPMELPQIEDA